MSDPLHLEDDLPARRLAYLGAWLLILVPFIQAVQQLWPMQLGNIRWRYGAANALSSILLLPYLGLLMLALISRSVGDRLTGRLVGAIGGVFAVGLLGSAVLFALDAQQLKAVISAQMADAFMVTTVRVVIVSAIFAVAFGALLVVAVTGGTRSSAPTRRAPKGDADGYGLIMRQEREPEA
jgi:hypothetical protein